MGTPTETLIALALAVGFWFAVYHLVVKRRYPHLRPVRFAGLAVILSGAALWGATIVFSTDTPACRAAKSAVLELELDLEEEPNRAYRDRPDTPAEKRAALIEECAIIAQQCDPHDPSAKRVYSLCDQVR